ncbi:permease [uncultured Halomonas sp.]|uniref:permease n=1 Tax=uncultured Halomonas sp. TaxID=173971 RepID=UPI00263102C1|nr:permease [uncultured Halomonas sp.]
MSDPNSLPVPRRLLAMARENPEQVRWLGAVVGIFLLIYFMPAGTARFDNAVLEGIRLTHWYAQEHVILCLLPAFVIAGAMATYLSQGAVMRYLGPNAPKPVAFGMASISGTLLAVCSCTVLPLFGGIYRRGAGQGQRPGLRGGALPPPGPGRRLLRPDGGHPGIRQLGRRRQPHLDGHPRLEVADHRRARGLFALLLMRRWGWPLRQVAILAGAVVLAALLAPGVPELAFAVGIIGLMLIATLRDDDREWAEQSWDFTKQIMPLLLVGVFVAGLLLGRPGEEGLIPSEWVVLAVGDNSFRSTFLASLLGGFMYFSTLTEVPIVQGLIGNGMGKGPALALLLAGPALSLPNMLVIRTIMGTQKTLVYCTLVVVMATLTGYLYGQLWP